MIVESLAIATITTTITKSVLFAPIRDSKYLFIRQLLHCPYCLAHYVSLIVAIYILPVPSTWAQCVHQYLVTVFALVAISSIFTFPLILYLRWLDNA